jgi:hypothetical protein
MWRMGWRVAVDGGGTFVFEVGGESSSASGNLRLPFKSGIGHGTRIRRPMVFSKWKLYWARTSCKTS